MVAVFDILIVALATFGVVLATENYIQVSKDQQLENFFNSMNSQFKAKYDDPEVMKAIQDLQAKMNVSEGNTINDTIDNITSKARQGLSTATSSTETYKKDLKSIIRSTIPAVTISFLLQVSKLIRNGIFKYSIGQHEVNANIEEVATSATKKTLMVSGFLDMGIETKVLPYNNLPTFPSVETLNSVAQQGYKYMVPVLAWFPATSPSNYMLVQSALYVSKTPIKRVSAALIGEGTVNNRIVYTGYNEDGTAKTTASEFGLIMKSSVQTTSNFYRTDTSGAWYKGTTTAGIFYAGTNFLTVSGYIISGLLGAGWSDLNFVWDYTTETFSYESVKNTVYTSEGVISTDYAGLDAIRSGAYVGAYGGIMDYMATRDLTITLDPDITRALTDAISQGAAAAYEAIMTYTKTVAVDTTTTLPLDDTKTWDDANTQLLESGDVIFTETPPPPTIHSSSAGWVTIYRVPSTDLNKLGNYMWSTDFLDNFLKLVAEPADAIINSYMMPYAFSGNYAPIKVGNYTLEDLPHHGNISGYIMSDTIREIDMGTIVINKKYNSFLDYEPFTKVSLYLPFIGIVQLSTNDVMGGTLSIKYRVDLYTGSVLALVKVTNKSISAIMYQYAGNMGLNFPLTSASYSRMYSGIMGASVALAGMATGGTAGILAGAAGAVNSTLSAGIDIQRSGSMGANAGALGSMKAYAIIERPVLTQPSQYNSLYGSVSNVYTKISTLTGYAELDKFNVNTISRATESEKQELESILKGGFFI